MHRRQRAMDFAPISQSNMHIKWEHESPDSHHFGLDTPPPSASFAPKPWGSPSTISWGQTMADYMSMTMSPPRMCDVPSSPPTIPAGHRIAARRSSDFTASPSYFAVDHMSAMNQPPNNMVHWLTPLPTPCSLMDDHVKGYVDGVHEWSTVRSLSSSGQSSILSSEEAFLLQSSPSPCSPDFVSPWDLVGSGSTFDADGLSFNFDPAASFVAPPTLPDVPVLPSQVNPPMTLSDSLEPLPSSASVLAVVDYQLDDHVHAFYETSSSPVSEPALTLPVRTSRQRMRRTRVPNPSRRATSSSSSSSQDVTLRNAVTFENGSVLLATQRGERNVRLERTCTGRYYNPNSQTHLYKCPLERCTAAFKRREHLTRHQLKHSGKCKWSCPLLEKGKNATHPSACRKRTSRHDNLMDHMSKHCRAWLVKLYPDAKLTSRSYPVSVAEAERLIIEDECGPEPNEAQLAAVEVKLLQLAGRLRKDFPGVPDDVLLFPMLRGKK